MKDFKEFHDQLDDLYELTNNEFEQCVTVGDNGLEIDIVAVTATSTAKLVGMILIVFPDIQDVVAKASFCEQTMKWIYDKSIKFTNTESMDESERNFRIMGLKRAADILKSLIDQLP